MQGLMSRAAARNQRDLARLQRTAAHEFALGAEQQDIRVRGGEAVETFFENRVGAVDQLLHERPPACFYLAVRINPSADAPGIARHPRGKVDDQLLERAVLLVVAE